MEFKKLSVTDADEVRGFLNREGQFSCENTFINLLIWQDIYLNRYCIKNNTLYIKSGQNRDVFRLPIGGELSSGIERLTDFLGGKEPAFWAQEGPLLDKFRKLYSDKYIFVENRDAFDYIYRRTALAELSGKKYHSKRNHISAFSKKYDWRYEPITPQNTAAVLRCAELWYGENSERLDKYLLNEKKGIELILSNMKALKAIGGAIFVGDRVVAFTIGSPINESVFDIHIEKALSDFSEGYTVINREFARRLPDEIVYINREDDIGLDGLRRAKLSYKPEILLKKYYCIPCGKQKSIYLDAFGDENGFCTRLFDSFGSVMECEYQDERPVSILFPLPCTLDLGDKKIPAKYIFAAATDKNYRSKGYMSRLIERVCSDPDTFYFLRPATDDLVEYYSRLGFKPINGCGIGNYPEITVSEAHRTLAEKPEDGRFTLMYRYCGNLSIDGITFKYSMI